MIREAMVDRRPPPPPKRSAPRQMPPSNKQPPALLTKEQLDRLHTNAVNERIVEAIRAIALELGNDDFTARVEQTLIARKLVRQKRGGPPQPRRFTTYVTEELGARLYARAKREKRDPQKVVAEAIEAYLRTELVEELELEQVLLGTPSPEAKE